MQHTLTKAKMLHAFFVLLNTDTHFLRTDVKQCCNQKL